MIGNDDCGQMSAWYIFSTLGFYPVNAGNGNFIFGSPQIKKAILKLPNNKKFYIKTDHFSQKNIYQSNPELNKTFINRIFLEYSEIMKGGVLKFHMQSE